MTYLDKAQAILETEQRIGLADLMHLALDAYTALAWPHPGLIDRFDTDRRDILAGDKYEEIEWRRTHTVKEEA